MSGDYQGMTGDHKEMIGDHQEEHWAIIRR